MSDPVLIYGANGYTGELVARYAHAQGLKPILAGRNEEAVRRVASRFGFESRIASLDDPAALDAALQGIRVVLHCAGPFSRTSRPMVDACIRSRVHYLDITGEISVFESLARRDEEAKAAGVMVLPGVGFDVVPSDCLAAHLKRRLPTATHLALGIGAFGSLSRGTATTSLERAGDGGAIRKDGRIVQVPAGHRARDIDFGRGPRRCITMPWGDVSTAFHSTGIPNVEVYFSLPAPVRLGIRASRYLGFLLASGPIQRLGKALIDSGKPGPDDAERARGRSVFWGEVKDADGRVAVSRLEGPEGYTLTVMTALAAVRRVLDGDAPAGFKTPSLAYGADFVLGVEGVTRTDLE